MSKRNRIMLATLSILLLIILGVGLVSKDEIIKQITGTDANASPGDVVEEAQSIAYAEWVGATEEERQNLIYASDQWLPYTGVSCLADDVERLPPYKTTDPGIYGRSTKFANFVYKALNSSGNLGLSSSITDDDDPRLRLVVDQDAETYTLGPYTISFPKQGDPLDDPSLGILGDLVWDEIVNEYEGKFIWGDINATIRFQDGTSETVRVDVLDSSGQLIEEGFPHFGNEFYIRYHADKDGRIVDFIKPYITINYQKKFTDAYIRVQGPRASASAMKTGYNTKTGYNIKKISTTGEQHSVIESRHN